MSWERPILNFIKTKKYPDNNILIENEGKYIDGPSVVYDIADANPNRRYKAAYYEHDGKKSGVRTKVSADGLNWSEEGEFPVLPSQDALKMYHDKSTGTFYMLLKDRILNRRSRLVSQSIDFKNWSEPREILSPNLGDDDTTNFYDMCMFKNGDITMAFLTLFDASTQFSHSELALAMPGLTVERFPSRPAVLKPGDLGAWDGGGIYTSGNGPIEINNIMRYYYYGSSRRHDNYLFADKYDNIVSSKIQHTGLGVAEFDKGRLCGQQFRGEGMFRTTAIKKTGTKLYVDAVAPAGLKISITRCAYSEFYEGYGCDECDEITGDGVHEVTWKSGKTIADINDNYIRIIAEGKNAIIYGFGFE